MSTFSQGWIAASEYSTSQVILGIKYYLLHTMGTYMYVSTYFTCMGRERPKEQSTYLRVGGYAQVV